MDVFGVIVLVTTEGIEENGVDAMRPSQMDRRGDVLGQKVEGAGDGYLYVTRVLPAMKKEMDAASFVNGARTIIGAVLN